MCLQQRKMRTVRSRVIDYNDIYEYSYDYSSYSRSLDGYDAEGQITSALQYVTKDSSELPVVYEITGHGETSLSGGFSEAIEKANMTLTELTLLKEEAVPDDASATHRLRISPQMMQRK